MIDPVKTAVRLAGRFAPGLVRRIAGDRAGDVAEHVVDLARRVTGQNDPAAIQAELEANAEAAAEFMRQAAEYEHELELAYLADVADARDRDIELARLGRDNRRADVLAWAAIAGLIAVLVLLFFRDVPDGPARDVILLLGGALIAIVKDVYAFEFGSSRGSKNKDALLSAARPRLPGGSVSTRD